MWQVRCAQTLLFSILSVCSASADDIYQWDPSGYIMYCPCMGRFGNQAEQFLGAVRFAKELNRTMVVPPWIAYNTWTGTSFTPYSAWFSIQELSKFHRVIPMETFMETFAPEHWPDDGKSRKVYCPSRATERSPDKKSCPAKIGNPFGPFWDNMKIDFASSVAYDHGKLRGYNAEKWTERFPPRDHPVIALMGAPGSFPVKKTDRAVHKYMKWSDEMAKLAKDFIEKHLERPYVGIHLRNGMDWVRACENVESHNGNYMASGQCCGYDHARHKLTKDMCLPKKDDILEKVKEVAKLINASHLFIATDSDAMIAELQETSLELVRYGENNPLADLAILTMADAFIGNCVSSFSAFVVRDREINDMPNYFFSFDHPHVKIVHDEF